MTAPGEKRNTHLGKRGTILRGSFQRAEIQSCLPRALSRGGHDKDLILRGILEKIILPFAVIRRFTWNDCQVNLLQKSFCHCRGKRRRGGGRSGIDHHAADNTV